MVGKCVSKENPKSDLDLDLGFVKIKLQIHLNSLRLILMSILACVPLSIVVPKYTLPLFILILTNPKSKSKSDLGFSLVTHFPTTHPRGK